MLQPSDLLTAEELAARLKVGPYWVREKMRKRCPNKIPFIQMGRNVRFSWPAVVEWLEKECSSTTGKKRRAA